MNMKFLVLGVIAIFIIAVVALGMQVGRIPPLTTFRDTCTGFNDIALSSVDYISIDPELNGPAWVLTVVQNCAGRQAVGTIRKDQVRDFQDNANSLYDFKITTTLDEQNCEYAIRVEGTPIRHMNYETKDLWLGLGATEWETECGNRGVGRTWFTKQPATFFYTCFWETETAKHGAIQTPSTTFKSSIKLESHGETKIAQISNQGPGSAPIRDVGYAYWQGNLVTGDQCPIAADARVDAAYVSGVWKTIDKTRYDEYIGYEASGFENCLTRYISYGTETPDSCVSAFNIKEFNALSGKAFISPGGEQGEASGGVYNGKVILNPKKVLQFPMITLRLEADWIGIEIPVGKPKVTSATSQPFRTGTTGVINADILNEGDGPGAFEVYVTCPSPFSQLGTSQFINLAPDQTQQVSIPITASAGEVIKKECEVCAKDRNNPAVLDCRSVQVTVQPQVVCSAGQRRCNGNFIEECNKEGTGWSSVRQCTFGCEIKNNIPVCAEEKIVCGDGICSPGEEKLSFIIECAQDCGITPEPVPPGLPPGIDYNLLGMVALAGVIIIFGAIAYSKRKKKKRRWYGKR